jgi:homoserine kinase type II
VIETEAVRGLWGVSPTSVERLGGTNNLSWRIESAREAYVLRVYQNEGNLPHVAYEHDLLLRLAGMGLSFAVPAPIRSRRDLTLEPVDLGDGRAFASLFHLIPGRHPMPGDPAEAGLAGAALGELDAALSTVDLPAGDAFFATHAHLERIHPLVPDPVDAVLTFEVSPDVREPFARLVERAQVVGQALYRRLPSQVIHADIARSNTLIDSGKVSGILDFEFAGPDLRVLDPAVGVHVFSADWSARSFSVDLTVARTFAQGYREWVNLSEEEICAVPELLRLRSAVSVIHRLGRKRAGLASNDDVGSRMREALRMDAWLKENQGPFLEAIASAE